MGDDGGFGIFNLLRWLKKHKPSDKRQGMGGGDKAKLRADRKRQRQARKK